MNYEHPFSLNNIDAFSINQIARIKKIIWGGGGGAQILLLMHHNTIRAATEETVFVTPAHVKLNFVARCQA